MGMPLKLTLQDKDYWFQIENERLVTKGTIEIPIIFDGKSVLLLRKGNKWILEANSVGLADDLIQAMGRALELRFRL
jgi:hypothetical protein